LLEAPKQTSLKHLKPPVLEPQTPFLQARGCRHNLEIEPFLHGNPDFGAEPLDIEDLVTIGREIGPCPYYLSRELMAAGAEILFMPYNYLIDKKHRETLKGVSWANTVLIFDEAHNLVRRDHLKGSRFG
jgi:hypothetical protein